MAVQPRGLDVGAGFHRLARFMDSELFRQRYVLEPPKALFGHAHLVRLTMIFAWPFFSTAGRIDFGREIQGYDKPVPASLFERGILENWKHDTNTAISFNMDPFQSRFNRLANLRIGGSPRLLHLQVIDDLPPCIVIPIGYFAFEMPRSCRSSG